MDIQKKRPILFNMENLNTNTINDDLFDDDGEFENSIFEKFLQKAKETENPSYMNYVGRCYLYGNEDENVQKNEKLGLEWLNKSIQKNNPEALHIVGKYYIKKSLAIYEKGEDSESYSCLAWIYEHGAGVQRDYESAMYWYKKLAENDGCDGPYESYYHLGSMYECGLGVEKDLQKALAYYRKCVPFNDKTQIDLQEAIKRVEKKMER